eukprot:6204255-Pleurochrysis_carterae.AAC.1
MLQLGSDEIAISLSAEKESGKSPISAGGAVPVTVRYYNTRFFDWEPLVETFVVTAGLRSASLHTLTCAVPVAIDANISDTMLRDVQSNVRAL